LVRVYAEHELVAIHDRAEPGGRRTNPDHLPPAKAAGVLLTRDRCREQAADAGPATLAIVEELLRSRPVDKRGVAIRLVRLAETYGAERLEAACRLAAEHGEGDTPPVVETAPRLETPVDSLDSSATAADLPTLPTGATTTAG
jgi:hypothetical protein